MFSSPYLYVYPPWELNYKFLTRQCHTRTGQPAPSCIMICLSMKKKQDQKGLKMQQKVQCIYATDFEYKLINRGADPSTFNFRSYSDRPSVTTNRATTGDGVASQNIEWLFYLNLRNVAIFFVVYVTILNFLFRFQIFSKPRWFIFQNVLGLNNRFIWRCFIMDQINDDISFWTIIHHSRLKLSDNLSFVINLVGKIVALAYILYGRNCVHWFQDIKFF